MLESAAESGSPRIVLVGYDHAYLFGVVLDRALHRPIL
jgi:hypothetical protein